VLSHPADSTDLRPCDFLVFQPLLKGLKDCAAMLEDVREDLVQWLRQQPKEFSANRIR
jgi:hypothetical protein